MKHYDEYGFSPYSNGAIIWEPGERCYRVIWYGKPGERQANTLADAQRMLEYDGGHPVSQPLGKNRPDQLTRADVENIVAEVFVEKIMPAMTSAIRRQADGL